MRRGLALVGTLLVAQACYSRFVEIQFEPSRRPIRYVWTLESSSTFSDPEVERTSKQELTADVTETATRSGDGVTTIELNVVPKSTIVDGRRVQAREAYTLELPVDETGQAAQLIEAGGVPSDSGVASNPSFFNEFRPPLPKGRVEIGSSWPADLKREEGKSSTDLKGRARLASLTVVDRRRAARIVVSREGSVTAIQRAGKAEFHLSGRSSIRTDTWLDLDDGTIVTSVARSKADYLVANPGGSPEASIEIAVVSKLKLLSR